MTELDVSPDRAFDVLFAAGRAADIGTESVPAADALGRVLREAVISEVDRPEAADSALDGYACLIADTASASVDRPVRLKVIGRSNAGAPFTGPLRRGEASYVATGGLIPTTEELTSATCDGAASGPEPAPQAAVGVVGVEHAAEVAGFVSITRPATAAAVRARARDLARGETYLPAGTVLGPQHLGLVAAMGHASVRVARRARVAIVSTGDELVAPGQALRPGQQYESNLPAVVAAARSCGCDVVTAARVADDPGALRGVLDEVAAAEADLVLTIGGISKGEREPVRAVLENAGRPVFRRVTARPGGPLTFFRYGTLPVLALPGNPVSSLVCFHLFARAFLDAAHGRAQPPPLRSRTRAAVTRELGPDGKTVFHRAVLSVDADGATVTPVADQSSAVSRSLVEADSLAIAPPGGAAAGDVVDVVSLRW